MVNKMLPTHMHVFHVGLKLCNFTFKSSLRINRIIQIIDTNADGDNYYIITGKKYKKLFKMRITSIMI